MLWTRVLALGASCLKFWNIDTNFKFCVSAWATCGEDRQEQMQILRPFTAWLRCCRLQELYLTSISRAIRINSRSQIFRTRALEKTLATGTCFCSGTHSSVRCCCREGQMNGETHPYDTQNYTDIAI